ncbi:MAG TPA: GNAT family N-acetyltransferase, partial [Candidatus Nitrosotenuis sp.]|nr:GNAT family N-acetyltransferase [Candidatus Nitrosotenuis sp.]
EANKIGIKLVKLYVFDSNKRARELYERIGFVAAGVVPKGVYHNKKYKDDIMMIKRS